MAEALVLRTGYARWLRTLHHAVGILALVSLLAAGAGPDWTAGALGALAVVHAWAARCMAAAHHRGRLHLAEDGAALWFRAGDVEALRSLPGGWSGALFCVLPLEDIDSGRRLRCILCRSLNRPDAYRRLLLHLRLQSQSISAASGARS